MPVVNPSTSTTPGLSMTALDIITSALRLIGVLSVGEQPTAPESTDALMVLNQMLDSWNSQRLLIFAVKREVFGLVAGQQAYQMGPNAPDFNTERPARIDRASIINLTNEAQPLELPIPILDAMQWQAIPVKAVESSLPTQVYDDNGFPFRTLSYWPIPAIQVQTAIYSWTALTFFPDLRTAMEFPPGYLKALRYNLAVDLAPEFGAQLDPMVMAQAVAAKADVKRLNIHPVYVGCDAGVTNQGKNIFNWLTGEPLRRV